MNGCDCAYCQNMTVTDIALMSPLQHASFWLYHQPWKNKVNKRKFLQENVDHLAVEAERNQFQKELDNMTDKQVEDL